MSTVYRKLLRLYPAAYRHEFGEEMATVFGSVRSENENKGLMTRGVFYVREIAGLIRGAFGEHVRALVGTHAGVSFSKRRFAMRNGFRFPKTTPILMAIILGGVVVAIQKGEAISTSLSHVDSQLAPIQPVHSTLLPPIALFLGFFYAAGLVGWAILFALHRSGVHQLAAMSGDQK